MVFERLGRKSEAIAEFVAAASLLQRAGDINRANQVVEYALRIDPESAEGQRARQMLRNNQPLPQPIRPRGGTGPVRMAEVRQLEDSAEGEKEQNPIEEARQKALVVLAELLFSQAEENVPTGQVARRGLSSLTRGTGGLSLGQAEQTRILLHLSQAIESQTQGQDAQAAEELERAREVGMSNPAAYFDLGLLTYQTRSQTALSYLQKAVKHPDFSLASYLLMAQIFGKNRQYTDALQAYLQALRLADVETVEPEQRNALRQLYEPIIESQGHRSDSANLEKLCENIARQLLRPDWRNHLQNARKNLPAASSDSQPLPLVDMLLETGSNHVVEALANVRRLAGRGAAHSALEEAYRALEYAPNYLPLHVQIGELLLQNNRQQEAINKFLLVAELYSLRGEASQAIQMLTKLTQLAPMDLTVRQRIIDLLVAQDRISEAVQQYMNLAGIYYQLAELTMARQTYTAALKLAQTARSERRNSVEILHRIADIDQQRLDWRQAIRIYEQIRTLEPEDSKARFQLVELNFRLGQANAALTELDGFTTMLENSGKRQKAVEFVEEIIRERPDKLEIRKRLSDIYLRMGKVEEGVQQLDMIADALLTTGNQNSAIAILQHIIRLKPQDIHLYEQALRELHKG